jgi:lipopolysaccharide/colanic/teichoic acid biosynthesis glycosyltransferase
MLSKETVLQLQKCSNRRNLRGAVWRVFDVIVAGTSLLIAAPLMAIVTGFILIETGSPILFVQMRLGLFGRPFRMYKFRKFYPAADKGHCVTLKGDRRMTRLGAVLERTKIDELPQLWNILKGDMSIVGPRPESSDLADCFTDDYAGVLEHAPGLFGPNQFYFRAESALYPADCRPEDFYRDVLFPLKARIDLAYFPNRTIHEDIGWIVRGVLALFGWRAFRSTNFETMLSDWLKAHEGRVV